MRIPNSTENPDLSARPPIPSEGFPIEQSSLGKAEPPFWDLLLDAGGRTAIAAAQRALFTHPPSPDDDLVSDVLRQYAGWVLDLPASEKHHHAFPNGLIRHSLEVASSTVVELRERWSHGPGCSILALAEQAYWLKVTFALGLFHDCGKILDINVRFSGSGSCWDPLMESLASFKARHGVDTLERTPHQFRPGRGLTGHEQKGIRLLPVILSGPRWDGLRPPLIAAFAALAFRHQVPFQKFATPLAYLAEQVHRADVRSAQRDRRKSPR